MLKPRKQTTSQKPAESEFSCDIKTLTQYSDKDTLSQIGLSFVPTPKEPVSVLAKSQVNFIEKPDEQEYTSRRLDD